MGFLWILHGPQNPRPHGDRTPVRPHKVSYKVSYVDVEFEIYFYKIILSFLHLFVHLSHSLSGKFTRNF